MTLKAEIEKRLETAHIDADTRALILAELPDKEESSGQSSGGTYLAKLAVAGFRGIGPVLEIEFPPAPGLTLIVGRNGSGKSSIAEAFEVLLTGDSARWAGKKQKAWKEGWANLHSSSHPTIEASLVEEGRPGYIDVERTWSSKELEKPTTVVRRVGHPASSAIPWTEALATHRPFLSYNELGGLLDDGSAALFGALSSILGLEPLTDAANAVGERRRAIQKSVTAASDGVKKLIQTLASVDDDRARRAADALKKPKTPDLAAIDAVIVPDTDRGDLEVHELQRLASLPTVDGGACARAAEALTDALATLAAMADTDSGRALSLAELLDTAIEHQELHGDDACPVCGTKGVVDDAWLARAKHEAAALRASANEATEAVRRVGEARRRAVSIVPARPSDLRNVASIDVGEVDAMWAQLTEPARTDDELIAGLRTDAKTLAAAIEDLRKAASAEHQARQDAWKPVATELASWRAGADVLTHGPREVDLLKAAEGWLKDAESDLRAERFAPIATRASEVWQLLRQQSSVDLRDIRLTGAAAKYGRRDVVLDVTVDGVEGAALSVMSQGELHSLALSLFLPRAQLPGSPFRFAVIDDPVQAMDPAKVEGLAQVLQLASKTHQVIVLTHDERLPDAIRRLDIPATVYEVARGERSQVTIERSLDPVERHLRDARSMLKGTLPAAIRSAVVPALCRSAVEAACLDAYRRRELHAGRSYGEIDEALLDNDDLGGRLSLVFGCPRGELKDVLPSRCTRPEVQAYYDCNRGTHEGFAGDLGDLINRSRSLAKTVRSFA